MGQAVSTAGIILIVLAVAAAVAVFLIKRRLRRLSRALFGTNSLIEGYKRQNEQLAEIPKSVSSMTKIYLPQITRDFPEFSLSEFTERSENRLKETLAAVEHQDLSRLRDSSSELKKQVELWIEDDKRQEVREIFQNVVIHNTAISRYERAAGICTITFQSAVEYLYARQKAGESSKQNSPRKKQTRYEMKWSYIQDVSKLPQSVKAIGFNCPNCGATVTNLGAKVCEYCGTALEPLNIRVWALGGIKEY